MEATLAKPLKIIYRLEQPYPFPCCHRKRRAGEFSGPDWEAEHSPRCRDPRCSLECRLNWAKKEAACNQRALETAQANGRWIGAGTLVMKGAYDAEVYRSKIGVFLKL